MKHNLKTLLNLLIENPEQLGIPAAYIVTEAMRYKQYGKYDVFAVRREGERLLCQIFAVETSCDEKVLRKWQQQYYLWQKKLRELKCSDLVHGELTENGKIILYEAAIREECRMHGFDYQAYYTSVLVHERLHYLHWQGVLRKFEAEVGAVQSAEYKKAQAYWFGDGYNSAFVRTVKEVIAEFGRYLWCVEQGQEKLANAVTERLTGARTFAPSYPYAAVRGLCALYERDADAAVRAYRKIWRTSLASWQKAWGMLEI